MTLGGTLRVIVIGLLLAWLLLTWFARRNIFHPMRFPEGEWDQRASLQAEDVWLTAADGTRLHGWYAAPAAPRVFTLFVHGNAGNVTHRSLSMRALNAAGSAVLVLDYRGFGRSEGSPSEAGVYQDARAAYAWLAARHAPDKIVIHGESIGTAVAVELAVSHACAGVVLEAPFPSLRAVAATILPGIGPLIISGFDTASRLPALRVPLLVIHGDQDEIIPYRLGRAVFDAAPQPKRFFTVPGAGHNDIVFTGGRAYVDALAGFYASLGR